jgi:rRNA processing protein Gar1
MQQSTVCVVPPILRLLLLSSQIPYFNAPIFLENKTQIGKVEEILGSINNVVSGSGSPKNWWVGWGRFSQ